MSAPSTTSPKKRVHPVGEVLPIPKLATYGLTERLENDPETERRVMRNELATRQAVSWRSTPRW